MGSFGIKNIKVVGEGEDCGKTFRKSPYDLNKDSGGKKLYLCKEKGKSNFITDIRVVNNKAHCPTERGYTIASGDLNEGSKTNPDPVYLCISKDKSSDVYIDTIFSWGKNGITYFFKGDSYWKIDDARQRVSNKYPQRINTKWGDLPDNLDAVFTWGKNRVTYFFKGNKYWEFDDDRLKIKPGYPKFINNFWKGVPDNISSVFTWGKDNKTYFFKGNMFYKFNDINMKVDRGYPRLIKKRWDGAPINFNGIFTYPYDKKTYIFRGDQLWMIGEDDKISSDYPRKIDSVFQGIWEKKGLLELDVGKKNN